MKVKTAELTGLALDWALAVAMGHVVDISYDGDVCIQGMIGWRNFEGHTDPAVCMGLIKEYCIQFFTFTLNEQRFWDATISGAADARGCDTPEIAVARCVVQMQLGDEVSVPDELCGVKS